MTNVARNIIDVESSLYSRREALRQQHAKLTEQHGAAALAAAEGVSDATKRIPAINQELREIQDELAALNAAETALDRRKHAAKIQTRIDDVKAAEAATPKAAEAISAAWDKFADTMSAMGSAWRELESATQAANELAHKCQTAGAMPNRDGLSNGLRLTMLQELAGKLLWIETNDKIEPNHHRFGNAPATPAEVRERIDYSLSQLKQNVNRHTERAVKVIQGDA
ncbi:hypothetical protein [Pseudomonas sp. SST3]|uniref:hypothetical protein n=1 Tax=Pseudomonas sp. SST3 TaxID=2267882 RepID=UPI000E0066D6|nr:hypothetical protein [Pseudomonas sp. SST3]NKQ11504.1 hypothetical protein [Pseudomonas sp. SST3]